MCYINSSYTKLLNRQIKHYSKNIPIHITENGMANKDNLIDGMVDDNERINYYKLHLKEMFINLGLFVFGHDKDS